MAYNVPAVYDVWAGHIRAAEQSAQPKCALRLSGVLLCTLLSLCAGVRRRAAGQPDKVLRQQNRGQAPAGGAA